LDISDIANFNIANPSPNKSIQHFRIMDENSLLTQQELSELSTAQTETDWKNACDKIKSARLDCYPRDWYEMVLRSGLMARVTARFGGSDQITISTIK